MSPPSPDVPKRPRGHLSQDGPFVSHELKGERVLRVLCYGEAPDVVDMLLLQCSDGIWQRFFLSVGMSFWTEVVGDEDAFAGYEDIVDEFVDVSERLGSKRLSVDTVEAREGAEWSVAITFDSGANLRLEATDPGNIIESDFRLVVSAAPRQRVSEPHNGTRQ